MSHHTVDKIRTHGVRPSNLNYLHCGHVAKSRKQFVSWKVNEFQDDKYAVWVLQNEEETRCSLLRARTANLQNACTLALREISQLYEKALASASDPPLVYNCFVKITELQRDIYRATERMKELHQVPQI